MARLAVYNDGTNTAVRVAKNNADNPWEIPITSYGKLSFDSLNQSQASPLGYFEYKKSVFAPYPSIGGGNYYNYNYPHGVSNGNATHRFGTGNNGYLLVSNEYLARTRGVSFLPFAVQKNKDDNGWVSQQRSFTSYTIRPGLYARGSVLSLVNECRLFSTSEYTSQVLGAGTEVDTPSYSGFALEYRPEYDLAAQAYFHPEYDVTYWSLPANNISWPSASPPVTAGKKLAKFTNSSIAIAKQGYDVETATPSQLLISDTEQTVSVIATGVVRVNAGATVNVALPSGIIYDDTMSVDCIVNEVGQNAFFPTFYRLRNNPSAFPNWRQGVDTRIVGSNLQIRNPYSTNLDCRYIVTNFIDSASAGTSDVRIRTTDDYVQLLKPNAHEPTPRVDDILLDTRFPYLPVVANGYWNLMQYTGNAGGPEASKKLTIPVNLSSGWYPFPMMMVYYQNNNLPAYREYYYSGPKVDAMVGREENGQYDSFHGEFSSQTVYAEIKSSSVVLNAFPRHPSRLEADLNGNNYWEIDRIYDRDKARGVRYFILAIPA